MSNCQQDCEQFVITRRVSHIVIICPSVQNNSRTRQWMSTKLGRNEQMMTTRKRLNFDVELI